MVRGLCSNLYNVLLFLARFECEAFERAIGRERIEASTIGQCVLTLG